MNYTKNNWTNDAGSADLDATNLTRMEQGIYDANTLVKTAAQWVSDNTVLATGQWGKESDTGKMKSGDGATAWNSLGYSNDHVFCGATKIYTKCITGTWPSSGIVSVPHGITVADIISVTAVVLVSAGQQIPPNHTINANIDYQAYVVDDNAYLVPVSGTSLLNKPYKIVLQYTGA